jgi:hypothetical protein
VDPGYALRQVIGPEILWNTLGMLVLHPALRRLRPLRAQPALGG